MHEFSRLVEIFDNGFAQRNKAPAAAGAFKRCEVTV